MQPETPLPPALSPELDAETAWSTAVELFLGEYQQRTRKLYRRRLRYWRDFLATRGDLPRPWDVDLDLYAQYRAHLSNQHLADATIGARLSPVRTFAKWLGTVLPGAGALDAQQILAVTKTSSRHARPRAPTVTVQQDILDAARAHSLRSSVLVRLILLAGLRPTELVAAELRHLVPEAGGWAIEIPRSRRVPLVQDTLQEIDLYLGRVNACQHICDDLAVYGYTFLLGTLTASIAAMTRSLFFGDAVGAGVELVRMSVAEMPIDGAPRSC